MEVPRMLQGFHVSSESYTCKSDIESPCWPSPKTPLFEAKNGFAPILQLQHQHQHQHQHHLHFTTIFLMSTEAKAETQPLTTPSYSSDVDNGIVKDVVLWRRKKINITVLVAATAAWVLMEVCELNFLTVISWAAIVVVASIFLYANMLRLLGKEAPNLLRLEVSEERGRRIANTVRGWIEEAIRWIFLVSAEKEWPVFVGAVVGLLSLSYLGSCMDLLTLVYMGILVGMAVPLTYVKNEEKIRRLVEWSREKFQRCYQIIDEKSIQKIKSRIVKDKKTE